MHICLQTEDQTIYQHGQSVKEHYFELKKLLQTNQTSLNWQMPDYLFKYREQILNYLISDDIVEEYLLYHDCSKPFCRIMDENGKVHFPGHAEKSYQIWLDSGGNEQSALLMKMDMDIHKLKVINVDEFIKRKECITLLLAGFSELHSNSKLFDGIQSVSFKIKYKHLDKIGKKIVLKLFGKL